MTEQPNKKSSPAPAVVLDTNVLLEAWVFKNPDATLILGAVSAHKLLWLTSCEMREEFIHVLSRGLGPRWPADWQILQERWESHATECPAAPNRPAHSPRCTDQNDQKFIDFALEQRAQWLISRDRAVLKLGPRCARLGLTVIDPPRWREIWLANPGSDIARST